jgi:hypothetical protein
MKLPSGALDVPGASSRQALVRMQIVAEQPGTVRVSVAASTVQRSLCGLGNRARAGMAGPSPPFTSDHTLVRGGHASLADRLRVPEQAIAVADRQAGKRLEELDDPLTLAFFQQPVHWPER